MKIQADVYLTTLGYSPMLHKFEMDGWKRDPITEKQKELLEKYGIAYARVKYKGQASMIIDVIFERNQKKLATPKQIQVLLKHNYTMGKIKYLTKEGAGRIISKYFLEDDDL